MEVNRNAAIAELDGPRASLSPLASAFLAATGDAHIRYVAEIGAATARLGAGGGLLAPAATQQVRLTQQFLDAQRATLLRCADTDAKVQRCVETAMLETAVLGTAIDDLDLVVAADDRRQDEELRELLDAWWRRTRDDGSELLHRTQRSCARWVELARLTVDDGALAEISAANATSSDRGAVGAVAGPTALGTEPGVDLPDDLEAVFAATADRALVALLDRLDDVLSADPPAAPLGDAAAVVIDLAPSESDRFASFWHRDPGAAPARRSVVRDAIVPMLVIVLALVALMAGIG